MTLWTAARPMFQPTGNSMNTSLSSSLLRCAHSLRTSLTYHVALPTTQQACLPALLSHSQHTSLIPSQPLPYYVITTAYMQYRQSYQDGVLRSCQLPDTLSAADVHPEKQYSCRHWQEFSACEHQPEPTQACGCRKDERWITHGASGPQQLPSGGH